MPLALVVYTRLLPERKAGLTIGPLVLIQTRYRGDKGLLAHEMEHARQFWVTFGLHLIPLSILPVLSPVGGSRGLRQACEAGPVRS
jgi:hypothetical protein